MKTDHGTTTNPQDDVEALRRGINEYIQYYCSGTEKTDHGLSLTNLNNFNLYEGQSDKA